MYKTCERCHLVHVADLDEDDHAKILQNCIAAQATAMAQLLQRSGKKATCGCGAPIFFVIHTNGKQVPYTEAGLNHFVDCPQRERYQRNTPA